MLEVIVRIVDIDGILQHHSLHFFINWHLRRYGWAWQGGFHLSVCYNFSLKSLIGQEIGEKLIKIEDKHQQPNNVILCSYSWYCILSQEAGKVWPDKIIKLLSHLMFDCTLKQLYNILHPSFNEFEHFIIFTALVRTYKIYDHIILCFSNRKTWLYSSNFFFCFTYSNTPYFSFDEQDENIYPWNWDMSDSHTNYSS